MIAVDFATATIDVLSNLWDLQDDQIKTVAASLLQVVSLSLHNTIIMIMASSDTRGCF